MSAKINTDFIEQWGTLFSTVLEAFMWLESSFKILSLMDQQAKLFVYFLYFKGQKIFKK